MCAATADAITLHHTATWPPVSCPLDLPYTQLVGWPALPGDVRMAGVAVSPPAAPGRTDQSPGHRDH